MIFSICILILFLSSCKDNSTWGITNPIGTSGLKNDNGTVTFTINTQQGQQGIIFLAAPSVSVKITQVTVSLYHKTSMM